MSRRVVWRRWAYEVCCATSLHHRGYKLAKPDRVTVVFVFPKHFESKSAPTVPSRKQEVRQLAKESFGPGTRLRLDKHIAER